MSEILDTTLLGNSVREWALAVALGLATLIALQVVRRVAVRRLGAIASRTQTHLDDVVVQLLGKTAVWFLLFIAIYVGARLLTLPPKAETVIRSLTVLAVVLQGGVWAVAAVGAWLTAYRNRKLAHDPAGATTIGALGFISKLAIWSIVLLLALDNMGVDISTLVTGLGVGGVAVALAVQNVLGDLFASLSIVLDKPFVIGDFLAVGDLVGNVEQIGLKTTRVRSLSGEQLIFSNADLLQSRIKNYGRMMQRRILFTIGVTYQTPREKLEKIPGILREAIEAQQHTRFDRSHFARYGDFSINFESVYFVKVPDYATYMDMQQAINLRIHEQFEKEEIEFAYPTQTLFLVKQEP
jgi:small-conductance mechanosensitive channel